MSTLATRPDLTPTQARAMRELFGQGQPRPRFDPDLGVKVRTALETELAPVVARLAPGDRVSVRKGQLALVHSCEGGFVASEDAGFPGWSLPTVRGVVAHKTLELALVMASPPPPLDLVDLAIERIIEGGDDWTPRSWLLSSGEAEVAEVRAAAADWVTKFNETFPPVRREWCPRVESPLKALLCDEQAELRGKVDLALGRPQGVTATVLIVDFKTGRLAPVHVEDLRFYALIHTIRLGVPPFRVATFDLDAGSWHAEDIDLDILHAAARRVVAGITAIVELRRGDRPPALTPGPQCRWCPAQNRCPAARIEPEEVDDLRL